MTESSQPGRRSSETTASGRGLSLLVDPPPASFLRREWPLLSIVVVSLVAAGVLFARNLLAAERAIQTILRVEEPAAAAAVEMEVNLLELGLDTWKFLATEDPRHQARAAINRESFLSAQAQYLALAPDAAWHESVSELFGQFSRLSTELFELQIVWRDIVRRVNASFDQVDHILDRTLQPSLDPQDQADSRIYLASAALEADVAEVVSALNAYMVDPNQGSHDEILEAMAECETEFQVVSSLSADGLQRRCAEDMHQFIREGAALLPQAIGVHQTLRLREQSFLELRQQVEDLLDSKVQIAARGLLASSSEALVGKVDRLRSSSMTILAICAAATLLATALLAVRSSRLRRLNSALAVENSRRREAELAKNRLLSALLSVEEKERQRLARDLHDELGQDLVAMNLELARLTDASTPEVRSAIGSSLRELTARLMRHTKSLAWELRPAALDDLGLEGALGQHVQEWSKRTGIEADFECRLPGPRFREEIESTAYRITQEALTNVAKHAHASHASITAIQDASGLTVVVEDDGRGFELASKLTEEGQGRATLGLRGMQERAALVGGSVTFEASPGRGTSVFVRLPTHPTS